MSSLNLPVENLPVNHRYSDVLYIQLLDILINNVVRPHVYRVIRGELDFGNGMHAMRYL